MRRQFIISVKKTALCRTSESKGKGYAFVHVDDPLTLAALARALWQQCVPTRKLRVNQQALPRRANATELTGSQSLHLVGFWFVFKGSWVVSVPLSVIFFVGISVAMQNTVGDGRKSTRALKIHPAERETNQAPIVFQL